ncbi:hypothetical protein DOY81_005167, partial [Sarcophaga bullata]
MLTDTIQIECCMYAHAHAHAHLHVPATITTTIEKTIHILK